MSTLANITSLNLSLQTGGAALAVNAVKSVAKPARTVYVFGTADDVAPNFTTVAGAITYAFSLSPTIAEPVAIRLFTKADGTPYDLTGQDPYENYIGEGVYFVSDFVRLNTTENLPNELPTGQQIWYIDANGVETLWVGREDGIAWPAVGYKEIRCSYLVPPGTGGFAQRAMTVISNNTGQTLGVADTGNTAIFLSLPVIGFTPSNSIFTIIPRVSYSIGLNFDLLARYSGSNEIAIPNINADYISAGNPFTYSFSIRIYP